jgi:hypothetical protein
VKKTRTPHQRLGGTEKRLYSRKERARRERIVVQQLKELSVSDPERFASMLELLAKLVAECNAKKTRA